MRELLVFQLRFEAKRLYRRAVRAARTALPPDGARSGARESLIDEIRREVRRRRETHLQRLDAWEKEKRARKEPAAKTRGVDPAEAAYISRERFELAEAKKRVEELETMLSGLRV